MLTYIDVHLIYTLPVIAVLALITWPFISRLELFKIAFVCTMAFVYTTPWDNYIIFHNAWMYKPKNILAVIGYVPVEEYMFFVIQTVMTSLWALVCTRWSPACFYFNFNKTSYTLIRWIPILVLAFTAIQGYNIAVPGKDTFYLGCILWWSCPVIMFLWYGAGNYFVKKSTSTAIAVIVPTLYLCWVDRIALKDDVWHINEKTSLNIFVVDDLPFEECLFFLITNVIIVLGSMAFDKSYGLADTYTFEFLLNYDTSWKYNIQQMRAFLTAECDMSPSPVNDIRRCLNVLKTASKSFNVASLVFPAGIRLHLIILYAFCRVTDDMIDGDPNIGVKKQKLALIERFIGEIFADRSADYDVKTLTPRKPEVDWQRYRQELTAEELSCFRAISQISFYLPRKPFYELLDGYRWDVNGKIVQNETDLLLYSSYVAGSVGTLCVYVMMYKSNVNIDDDARHNFVIEKAQQMGQVLQIVNISRDIVTDSETLGRCYVPAEYMDDAAADMNVLCADRNPWTLGSDKLKAYTTRMISLAKRYQLESLEGIRFLPYEVRGPVLVATDIYRGVACALEASPTYPRRASLNKWEKILIGVNSLYVKSLRYFYQAGHCKRC
ncbi:bifunctional lycopene cyclase/phytoene synthase-like [Melanaphis sacchari]|uniref:Bifunctional lycopene cyclase/phytoene synthase n=1 Tax=Melanaphis sacchari TaxID=742174 RepID=A0A2H8TCG3_9HEMI|nr:bifunctional lycopene cyclase/phytoene synthase-like [Melanaphis sacchari]XP_025196897.1 bifunctional lycopene cyclase/phytoene synthase-like [Melanaphis sacchari]XP_025196898.1 bifunctional lycopene cyclase/phytoene synthase-like [Melanaphis sacchari]XP_025196899.1 bifunctional lycopene cyclase/phytoene synthase-like [Melanaphis sacchari]